MKRALSFFAFTLTLGMAWVGSACNTEKSSSNETSDQSAALNSQLGGGMQAGGGGTKYPDDKLVPAYFGTLDAKWEDKSINYGVETNQQKEDRIAKVVGSVNTDSAYIATLPGLMFSAHEASHVTGTYEFDHVVAFRNQQYDLYILHQHAQTQIEPVLMDISQWRKYAIVVDKYASPMEMFYMRFDGGTNKLNFATGNPNDDCTHCHASGPRAVRPRAHPSFTPLSEEEFKKISDFNAYVKSYGGAFVSYFPHESQELYSDANRLNMPRCVSCHRIGGVRAPLFRHHKMPIMTLVTTEKDEAGYHAIDDQAEKRAMPPDAALTAPELACLKSWFESTDLQLVEILKDMEACKTVLGIK